MSEGGEAQQPRLLRPQRHHLGHDGAVVGIATVLATPAPGREGLLAQVPPGREGQEGLDDRARQRDGVLAFMTAIGGGARHRGLQEIRQAGEPGLVRDHERIGRLVLEHVLTEARTQLGQALADSRQALLRFRIEPGTGADEAAMPALQEPRLLGVEAERLAAAEHGVDAGEQRVIHHDRRPVARGDRRERPFQRLQRLVRVGPGEIVEHAADTRERPPGPLQGFDRVGEIGRGGIGDDRRDLARVLGQRRLEGHLDVLGPDLREGRQAERRFPGTGERIAGGQVERFGRGHQAYSVTGSSGGRPSI